MFVVTVSSLSWLVLKMATAGGLVSGVATLTGHYFDGKGGKKNARKSARSARQKRDYSDQIQAYSATAE